MSNGTRPRSSPGAHGVKTGGWVFAVCALFWVAFPEVAAGINPEHKALVNAALSGGLITVQQALGSTLRDATFPLTDAENKPWWYWPVLFFSRLF